MMKGSLLIVLIATLVAASYAANTCSASITFRARSDAYSSWMINATRFQIYDIVVANSGTCDILSIVGIFSGGVGFISESWNYNSSTGSFSNFGAYLPVGQSFYGAGFVLANGTQPTLTITTPTCAPSCTSGQTTPPTSTPSTPMPSTQTPSTQTPSTQSPSTQSPSTQSPSTQTPTTVAPTQTPSTQAPANNSCSVTAVLVRDAYSWVDGQGLTNYVWRLTITNNGPCALATLTFSVALSSGTVTQMWNLMSVAGGYMAQGYGPKLAAGQISNVAGFIVAGGPQSLTVVIVSSTCAC